MLRAIATHVAVQPIHVLCIPISCDEGHTLLEVPHHGVELRVVGAHAQHHLTVVLAESCCEREIDTIYVKPV